MQSRLVLVALCPNPFLLPGHTNRWCLVVVRTDTALLDTTSGPGGLTPAQFSLRLLKATGLQIGSWGAGMAGELEHDSERYARISWLQPIDVLRDAFEAIETFVTELRLAGAKL